jgi:hypothetical protein
MSILNPYSTTITEIELDHRNDRDIVRLVVVEQDVEVPHGEIDLLHWFNDLAGKTNWADDADYHYAGRGGLVMNLPDVSSHKLRNDVIWGLTQGCKRFGYQPSFTLPFEEKPYVNFGGKHVKIALLNGDYYGYDKRSPQERLCTHLQLHYGLFYRRPAFPLLTQLVSGTGYVAYGDRRGQAEMLDEIVVVTASGTRAFQLEIVDEEERALDYDMVD